MRRRPTAFEVSFPGEVDPEAAGDSEADIQKAKRKSDAHPADVRVSYVHAASYD